MWDVEQKWRIKTRTKNGKCRTYIKKINYNTYHLSLKELFFTLLKGVLLLLTAGYLFYGSWGAAAVLSPFLVGYFQIEKRSLKKKRMERLQEKFKEALLMIGDCMEAGYSVENAFVESYYAMRERFGDSEDMVQELNVIRQGLKLNVKIEELLMDLAVRSKSEDMKDFAVVFSQAKRGGGNMISIMKRTIEIIKEKIEVNREIQIMLSGKKYEQRIMSLVPLGVMAYISITSSGFFNVLYHNMAGILIMSICLLVYALTVCFADYLMQIEV